ncbi:TetR family transcriptional regulator C-terminal domain-containing protein [Telluria beijingensis]|uniref:TetR family transcriptional regulator C-terminal domain-containing protein n=1 Tax=Telluria beijingensis TaxID=3068633 RepID=UPI002795EA42|nr:TetR family transcriptional regulator C-terminal domain-containing protein [Massilia sp. REN29]
MPMDTAVKQLGEREIADPLQRLRDEMMAVLQIVVSDEKSRRVFEIATLKTEFTEEVDSARVRKREAVAEWRARMEAQFAEARANGQLPAAVDPHTAATGMWVMLDGLLRNWLFDLESFDLMALGGEVIDTFLAGLKAR